MSVRIDVSDIKEKAGLQKRTDLSVNLEPVEFSGQEVRFPEPFTGTAEIWNLGDRLLVRAEVSGAAELVCSRCLKRYTEPVSVSFDEEFVEAAPGKGESDAEEDAESGLTVSFSTDDEIDLTGPLRDNILLALPMKPLCREDCKGLCPRCGKDLNEGPCNCDRPDDKIDPRLAVLQDLLRKPDSHS